MYLKIENCNPEQGEKPILDSLRTSKCSVWRVQAIDKEDCYSLSAEYGGLMLGATATEKQEASVCQTAVPSGSAQQHWVVIKTKVAGQFLLKNSGNELVLSVADGNKVSADLPTVTSGQEWEFVPAAD